jgi:hypothetical protein
LQINLARPASIRDALRTLANRPQSREPENPEVKKMQKLKKRRESFFFGSPLIYVALSFTHLALACSARISL